MHIYTYCRLKQHTKNTQTNSLLKSFTNQHPYINLLVHLGLNSSGATTSTIFIYSINI